jgi:hexosaminidase
LHPIFNNLIVMKKIPVVLLLICCIAIDSCNNKKNIQFHFKSNDIKVTWKLITNPTTDIKFARASFTFENSGESALDGKNWAMFFSQFNTGFHKGSESGPVTLESLGGDFCRLSPKQDFKLDPGKSLSFSYDSDGSMIKLSDAPQGVYFVFYDNSGNEVQRMAVNNYIIAPFTSPGQINRRPDDNVPIPDAQFLFNEYKTISKLDASSLPPFVPEPKSYQYHSGSVTITQSSEIHFEAGLENEADNLIRFMEKILHARLKAEPSHTTGKNIIILKTAPVTVSGISKEAYTLDVSGDKGITITGNDASGVFYGIESLVNLVPVAAFQNPVKEIKVRNVSIKDAPSFPYRGMHLDVARDFFQKGTVIRLIDAMAFYKLNRLHLHLTDDEGWRLEIKELPELTEVGSKRGHTLTDENYLHPSYGSGPEPDSAVSHGTGFYSREDFIEILKHAYKKHISIIPELEMPGHARAAIKSMEARYRKLMAAGRNEDAEAFRLIDPDDLSEYTSAQGYHDNVVCVARESVYHFYETVLDDITGIYKEAGVPLVMFQVAGDEVPSGSWEKSPMCVEFMKSHPETGSAKGLQPYFFGKIIKMIEDRNIPVGGWEEMAMKPAGEGSWIPNPEFAGKQIYPFVWNSVGRNTDLGYRLANAGYPIILCNVTNFYFDMAYDKDPREPGLYWGGFVSTKNAFKFVPYDLFLSISDNQGGRKFSIDQMEQLKPGAKKNIIGLQGELWSETIKGRDSLEHDYLPKMLGLAHSAWNGQPAWASAKTTEERLKNFDREWNTFVNQLAASDLPRLDYIFGGYNYRISPPGIQVINGKVNANTEFPGMVIRYTLDGSDPVYTSPEYTGPFEAHGTVRMKTYNTRGRSSITSELVNN